jgi:hypothetical protein
MGNISKWNSSLSKERGVKSTNKVLNQDLDLKSVMKITRAISKGDQVKDHSPH